MSIVLSRFFLFPYVCIRRLSMSFRPRGILECHPRTLSSPVSADLIDSIANTTDPLCGTAPNTWTTTKAEGGC